MAYTAKLLGASSPLPYEFEITPFLGPSLTPQHDDGDPPLVTGILERYSLDGILRGTSETTTAAAWADLRTALASRTNPVTGVQLLRSGTAVATIQSRSAGGSHDAFKVTALASPVTEGQWRTEMRFTLTAEGLLTFADATTGIVDLVQVESWDYDEAGLVTRTRTGRVTTQDGTSAAAKARTQGFTSLPGVTYGYVTGGPEGVNVRQMNRADTEAEYTSIVAEIGETRPAAVGPTFAATISTVEVRAETRTVTSAAARGTGAEDYVVSLRPAGELESASLDLTAATRSARATYVQTRASSGGNGRVQTTRRFTLRPGGARLAFSERSGERLPVMHVLAKVAAELVEQVDVEHVGEIAPASVKFPAALNLPEDPSAMVVGIPYRVSQGATPAGDRWQASMTRVYRAPEIDAGAILSRAVMLGEQQQVGVGDAGRAANGGKASELPTDGLSARATITAGRTTPGGRALKAALAWSIDKAIRYDPFVGSPDPAAPTAGDTTPPAQPGWSGDPRTLGLLLASQDPAQLMARLAGRGVVRSGRLLTATQTDTGAFAQDGVL